jgi:hypothetical protein
MVTGVPSCQVLFVTILNVHVVESALMVHLSAKALPGSTLYSRSGRNILDQVE